MTQTLISQEAEDLIIAEEVTGQKTYENKYRRPERPGGASGITIAIGYDVGYATKAQLHADWDGKIPVEMITVLERCCGVTSDAAQALLPRVRDKVDVPWGAAIDVFEHVDIPRWYDTCKKYLDNFDTLSLDCKGALLSLAYNRGPSFKNAGARYVEMNNIRKLMAAKNFKAIPAEFRKMQRLWTNKSVRGVYLRREHEARLFEKGLQSS